MTVDGVRVIPLQRFEDERGWFSELMRSSGLPKPRSVRRTSSFSRAGRDPRASTTTSAGRTTSSSACAGWCASSSSTARRGETFTEDIGDDNPVAVYVPGHHAHGFEALTDCLFCYHVTEEYDPDDPDEHGLCWADPRVEAPLEHGLADPLRARPRRVLITGAGGQLGAALREVVPGRRRARRAPSST